MKKLKFICSILFFAVVASSCNKIDGLDQDTSFLNSIPAPSTPSKIFDISNDNSGMVKITPLGEGISTFKVIFGHGTGTGASAMVTPGSNVTHAYPEGTYSVTIVGKNIKGDSIVTSYPLSIVYRAPENLNVTLTQSGLNLKVNATADYAASYLVYYGDVANEVGTPLAKDGQVTHNYTTTGSYDVKVVALSGGAAKSEKVTPITVTVPFGLPIDFESTSINYFFGTFGGGQAFAKVANPDASGLNTSALVGKFTRGWEGWSGTYSPLDYPIDMTNGKKIKVLVYNPDAARIGAKLNIELEAAEGGSPANGVGVLKTAITTSGAWEELVFDFSSIPAVASAKFNQLVLRYDDSADGAAGVGAIIYIDNIRQTN